MMPSSGYYTADSQPPVAVIAAADAAALVFAVPPTAAPIVAAPSIAAPFVAAPDTPAPVASLSTAAPVVSAARWTSRPLPLSRGTSLCPLSPHRTPQPPSCHQVRSVP